MVSIYKNGQTNISIPSELCSADGDILISLQQTEIEDPPLIEFNPNTSYGVIFIKLTFYEAATEDLPNAIVSLGAIDTQYDITIYFVPTVGEPVEIWADVGRVVSI